MPRKKTKKKTAKKPAKIQSKKAIKSKVVKRLQKNVPVWVKVISIFYYISSVVTLFLGVIFLIGGLLGSSVVENAGVDFLANAAGANALDKWFWSAILTSMIAGGFIFLVLGVFEFFVARYLWEGMNWARIAVIIFMILGFVFALFDFDWLTLIISGLIGGYLTFNNRVKQVFLK